MQNSLYVSDSLVGSLCREVDNINYRTKDLQDSINSTKDSNFYSRLKDELISLNARRLEILRCAKELKEKNSNYDYSIEFLIEICYRGALIIN